MIRLTASVIVAGLLTPILLWSQSTPASPARTPIALAVAGGTIGSLVGSYLGSNVGEATVDCSIAKDDSGWCGFREAVFGYAVGSVVGASLGAYVSAKIGGAHPSAVKVLLASTVGVGTGLVSGIVADRLFGGGAFPFIGYSIGQGALAGLVAARWP